MRDGGARAPGLVSCAAYNALSMRQSGRYQDVFAEFSRTTFVGLLGTRDRADPLERVTVEGAGSHRVYKWPAGKGSCTNACTGCAIGLHKAHVRPSHVRKVWDFPAYLQGRLGAVRVKNSMLDVA
eukprot:15476169-Alexandrium_andersonii.AAC.1